MLTVALYVFAYGIIGNLLGRWVCWEYSNHTPTSRLPFWRKVTRFLAAPYHFLDGGMDSGWPLCLHDGANGSCFACKISKEMTAKERVVTYMFFWPIFGLVPSVIIPIYLVFACIYYSVGGIISLLSFVAKFAAGKLKKKAKAGSFGKFDEAIGRVRAIWAESEERGRYLTQLIEEGNALALGLGENGAAARCKALTEMLAKANSAEFDKVNKARAAALALEKEQKNFNNLSQLLEFYKKATAANAAGKSGLAEVETAMAEALASCENILNEFSSAEIEQMAKADLPVETLEAQVKDFCAERNRLRSAQEKALAV